MTDNREQHQDRAEASSAEIYWRVEGSLLNLSAVRPVAFFTWNAQSFAERWARRAALALSALFRPLLYASNRVFATRILHMLLRGVSRDRLDLLGEEYFNYDLKPLLKAKGVEKLRALVASGREVVLVGQGLDHVMRPLAEYLGVERLIANRLEFRDGLATGRLLEPVIRPRGALARITGRKSDGRVSLEKLARDLGMAGHPETLRRAIIPARRTPLTPVRRVVIFDPRKKPEPLSVRQALAGKNILLVGVTGFIGKVWLVKMLEDLPKVGKIFLLIRRQRSISARQRFEKIVTESPLFEKLHQRHADLPRFIAERVEVVEGDISLPRLGLDEETHARLQAQLDVIVNSAGLTDFNPDLRQALSINVEGTLHLIEFLRGCDHAALMHLSTCYVVGSRDGRIQEVSEVDYTPGGHADFNAEREREFLHALAQQIEARGQSEEITEKLRRRILARAGSQPPTGAALESQLRKARQRWVRDEMIEQGMQRAQKWGWPNTYTFTKSLAESLIGRLAADLPVTIVRPSIVETSTQDPFRGWNEGVNTSAPISYLLGTYFRQLPSNDRKRLDLIPVDLVCRGMTLIAAALVLRRHERVYQLATSSTNPCDMRRSVELTGLAHRKYYVAQDEFKHRFRARFDSITVSKERYVRLSAPRQKAVVQAIQRLSAPLPLKRPLLVQIERGLERVEKLIALYEPFILHNEQIFEAENVELLSEALPEDERAAFGYDATTIDWWEYWINIHIPALRRWSYPLIEGRPIEMSPPRAFQMPAGEKLPPVANSRPRADKMIGTEAT